MKFISEILLTGIVKEYVEKFRKRTERENKNTLFSIFYWIEEPYLERIKELEEENAELKERCERKTKALVKLIEQTEKMKRCTNCENYPKQPTNTLCKYSDSCGKELDKWELAE